jgi:hypothetical protein
LPLKRSFLAGVKLTMAPASKVCRDCLGLLDAWGAATRAHAELAIGMSKVAASGDRAAFARIHHEVAAARLHRSDTRTAYSVMWKLAIKSVKSSILTSPR